jgi:hypothetical protein
MVCGKSAVACGLVCLCPILGRAALPALRVVVTDSAVCHHRSY